jgi:MFS family permease
MTSFSVATVAGVPAGLMFANLWGWHFAFFAIGVMCLGVGALAFYALPSLDAHIAHGEDKHVLHGMVQVLSEHNQRMALFLSATMMFAAFTIIPYITLYLQNNHVMTASEIPWLYFCGGDLIHGQMDWRHYRSPWQASDVSKSGVVFNHSYVCHYFADAYSSAFCFIDDHALVCLDERTHDPRYGASHVCREP